MAAAQVPWAEPDSRLTSGFEMECAWPAAVASQKTAGGFPRIAWRTAAHIARRVAARLESSMPCMFDGPTAIGVDETSCRKGAHVHHRGRRPQAQTGRLGARRIRQGGARPVLPTADRRAARLHQGSHRRRRRMDRRQREGAPAERRARPGLVPHRLPDERRARPGQETVAEPDPARQRQDGHGDDERPEIRRAQEPRRPDRTAIRSVGDAQGHGSQGPALPVMATQGTPQDAPAPTRRTSRGRAGTMDLPGFPQPHPRDRRTVQEESQTQGRHPQNHQTRPLQRQARGIQQQDQGHHPHGLRLPPRRRPHRHDQTPMQRPTHPPTNIHPPTHENSRKLKNQRTAEVGVVPTICTMAPIGRKSYTHLASSTCMLVHPCDFGVPLAMPAVFHGAPWKPSPWL